MSTAPAAAAPPRRRALDRLLWALLVAVLLGVTVAGLRRALLPRAPRLDVMGSVPPFSLVERSGKRLGSDALLGRAWVADFIFTRCSGICPVLSTAFAELQKRVPDPELRLVSISVDPLHDTPEVLRAYADGYGADPRRWLFLTGERDAIHRLVRDGFRLSVAEAPPGTTPPAGELVTHSDRLVLVDGQMRIRGYYHGTERADVDRLVADLERLRAEARR